MTHAGLSVIDVRDRWLSRRDELARLKALVDGASLCGEFLSDLDRLASNSEAEVLTVTQAAECSGFSADHIGRLVREGKLSNAGRKHAPRVFARELPARPRLRIAELPDKPYDPVTDARSLRSRR
jgi:hypothetical protein